MPTHRESKNMKVKPVHMETPPARSKVFLNADPSPLDVALPCQTTEGTEQGTVARGAGQDTTSAGHAATFGGASVKQARATRAKEARLQRALLQSPLVEVRPNADAEDTSHILASPNACKGPKTEVIRSRQTH